MKRKTILLNGPSIDNKSGAYGGGVGGAARNMQIYLDGFCSERFELMPCFNSVRQPGRAFFLAFPWRLATDIFRAFRLGLSASGIHILGHYRTAVYREYCIVLVSRLLRLPILYHVKAGAFIDRFHSCRALEKTMIKSILRSSEIILCEGLPYVEFIERTFGLESFYFPNFILASEMPCIVEEKLMSKTIRVLFVGYCYEEKGVFELIRGCKLAAENGLSVELTLVGEEARDFTRWLDSLLATGEVLPFNVRRLGRVDHDTALLTYYENDVFVLPTRHPGEGHNNSINEAMMMGLVIVTTRHGFLESVLGENCSYFLEDGSAQRISEMLLFIDKHRSEARLRAKNARARLSECFSSDGAFKRLEGYYCRLTNQSSD